MTNLKSSSYSVIVPLVILRFLYSLVPCLEYNGGRSPLLNSRKLNNLSLPTLFYHFLAERENSPISAHYYQSSTSLIPFYWKKTPMNQIRNIFMVLYLSIEFAIVSYRSTLKIFPWLTGTQVNSQHYGSREACANYFC